MILRCRAARKMEAIWLTWWSQKLKMLSDFILKRHHLRNKFFSTSAACNILLYWLMLWYTFPWLSASNRVNFHLTPKTSPQGGKNLTLGAWRMAWGSLQCQVLKEAYGCFLKCGTQQPWVFLLKMLILGCFGGTTIKGNTHISTQHLSFIYCRFCRYLIFDTKIWLKWKK